MDWPQHASSVSAYLEDHVHEELKSILARILAGNVGRSEINEVGSSLGTDGMYQHLLAGASRSSQQHRPDQRTFHVHCR